MIGLVGTIFALPSSAASSLAEMQRQATSLEMKGQWYEACALYDQILLRDRNQPKIRRAFRRTLRHLRQDRRFKNSVLQQRMADLAPTAALDLYQEVLSILSEAHVERDRAKLTKLFRAGLKELRFALDKPGFSRRYLLKAARDRIHSFRAQLDQWMKLTIRDSYAARDLAREIVLKAAAINLRPGVVILELACGACHSLDEHTCYLSPHRMTVLQAAKKNKFVGIGIELSVRKQRLVISRVHKKSPAEEMGLARGDRLVRIDGHWLDPHDPDAARDRLLGGVGSTVGVEMLRLGKSSQGKVSRQAVAPTSVDFERIEEAGRYLGYIRIHHFQASTGQEVKEALAQLEMMSVEGIILDLRDNPGGAFRAGLQVAELFLEEGVITRTSSPLPGWTRTYRVQNPAANELPLVVLVNSTTASAAEVVAAALKDNKKRAYLIGSTTFGKGSIQCSISLERAPGGLHLTFARFTTPNSQPLNERGVVPDLNVARNSLVLKTAIQYFFPPAPMTPDMQ